MKLRVSDISQVKSWVRWITVAFFVLLIMPSSIAAAQPNRDSMVRPVSPFAVEATQCVDFNQLAVDTSVEGLGTVNPYLNISTSTGGAVTLQENQNPFAYRSLTGVSNFGMGALGGFADESRIHDYNFSFAPGVTVASFSVRILDYGDFNPVGATEHDVTLVALDVNDAVVASDSLTFASDGKIDSMDELWLTGDSTADLGNPGNYMFSVTGSGIVRLELRYSSELGTGPTDPLHGLTVLCFTLEGDSGPDIPAEAVCADFAQIPSGSSVEGLGTLHPSLNISTSTGGAIALQENQDPFAYRSVSGISNFGMGILGGFSDVNRIHEYSFTFAPDVTVSDFTVQMLDYGDFNPVGATEHTVTAVAYNGNDEVVAAQTLYFESDGSISNSDELWLTGDSTADLGNPGNYLFVLSGSGIERVELKYASNVSQGVTDPLHGLAVLCFVEENETPDFTTGTICADFTTIAPGESVEGLGRLHPYLNISTSTNNAVALHETLNPFAYRSVNGISNYGMGVLGGFSDASRVHDYTFSFRPDITVSTFTVRMLDYGDFNPVGATEHTVSLVAYDVNNNVVNTDTLVFTSDGSISNQDELWFTGDSTAALGEPGNYAFSVTGSGIARLELEYGSNVGSGPTDPLHGLAIMCFVPEEQTPDLPEGSICADFTQPLVGASVEGLGTIHPDLNISSSTGNAVALQENMDPFAYRSIDAISNYGMGSLGGFSDSSRVHDYSFTFAPNVSVSAFTLRLLDYGDFNPVGATEHSVSLLAYDSSDNLVSSDTLSFTSDGAISSSDALWFTGDSTAVVGDPGNYLFTVMGNSITRLELEYGSNAGNMPTDPLHGLAVLCFVPEDNTVELDPPTASLDLIELKAAPLIGGKYRVHYACSENAPNLVSATINGYDVIDGQQIRLIVDENELVRYGTGPWANEVLLIQAPEFSFDVTCADDSGNEVSTSVVPEFVIP